MKCPSCEREYKEGAQFCPNCGVSLPRNTNNESNSVQYASPVQQSYQHQPINDKSSVMLNILSFLIPVAGLILFLCNFKDKPQKAKGCGISALISVGINVLLQIIMVIGASATINLI